MNGLVQPGKTVALLDTTVQIDRMKMPEREQKLSKLLEHFDWTVSTSISLLEFKAVLIQECITIHNRLREDGRFFIARDRLLESQHPQSRLRSHIFNNLICVFGVPGEVSDVEEQLLAEKARLQLENVIPRLYSWFIKSSTSGGVLRKMINCTRAFEPPTKGRAAFRTNLPKCHRGNKSCTVEKAIRDKGIEFVSQLRQQGQASDQLLRTADLFQSVHENKEANLSHSECRRAGDTLIALEAAGIATHCVSSNAREWKPIAELFGLMPVDYSNDADASIPPAGDQP